MDERITVSAACNAAAKQVRMYQFGKQWIVEQWSEDHRAWWQGNPQDYYKAHSSVTRIRIEVALRLLGDDHDYDIDYEMEKRGGRWQSIVAQLVQK